MAELGAILVVVPQSLGLRSVSSALQGVDSARDVDQTARLEGSLACEEILGRSLLERTVDRLRSIGVELFSVVTDQSTSNLDSAFRYSPQNVTFYTTREPWAEMGQILSQYAQNGINTAFIVGLGSYVEFDAEELLQFHREARQPSTRAFSMHRPLELWVMECDRVDKNVDFCGMTETSSAIYPSAIYPMYGFVRPLSHAGHLRHLVVDALQGRCQLSPVGKEIKPRVWVDDDVNLHRRARVVAPAYIGRASSVREDTLITRCSNIESFCEVDFGTAIEDTSVLSNSYVGIWLDVSHAVVSGDKLLSLSRNVTLNVADESMLRKNLVVRKGIEREIPVEAAGGFFGSLSQRSELVSR